MKKAIVAGLLSVCLSYAALAGERAFCSITMPTDQTSVSTADQLTVTGCASTRLQSDGGIYAETEWYDLSDGGTATGDGGALLPDGGPAGCLACNWGAVRSLVLQCNNAVYYSERWDGGSNAHGAKGSMPASSSDFKVDFDVNPDPYKIDMPLEGRHISISSVTTDANTCKVGLIFRAPGN